jgi:hypothetical protein
VRILARRVRLNSGGYDSRGHYYFGGGGTSSYRGELPLYDVRVEWSNDEYERRARQGLELDFEGYVRAISAPEARRKFGIEKGLVEPTLIGNVRLAARLWKAFVRELPFGSRPTDHQAQRWLRKTLALAKRVRAETPGDISWRYFDSAIVGVRERMNPRYGRISDPDREYVMQHFRNAIQSIQAAAERGPKHDPRDPRCYAHEDCRAHPEIGRACLLSRTGLSRTGAKHSASRDRRRWQWLRQQRQRWT